VAKRINGSGFSITDRTAEFMAVAETAVEEAITRGTIRVQAEAVRLVGQFSGPPLGSPSAPGEPPHVRTGTLRRSIGFETFRIGRMFVGRVGTNLKYGRWLEEGTSRMAPRPYLRPALDSQRNRIVEEIEAAGGDME